MFLRDMRVLCQEAEKSASLQLIGLQVTVLSILLFDYKLQDVSFAFYIFKFFASLSYQFITILQS